MIYEEYRDLESSGHIYGYYLDNKCVGLITFRPMRLVDHHPVYYEHPEKDCISCRYDSFKRISRQWNRY